MKGRRQIITYSLGFRVGKCNNNQLNMPNNKAHMLGGVNHRIYTQTLEILCYLLWIVIRIARNCLFWTGKSICSTLKVKLMLSHFYLVLTIKLLLQKVKLFVCFEQVNLFQKHLFFHNMTMDCSLNLVCTWKLYKLSTYYVKTKNNLCTQHVLNLHFSCELVIQWTICHHIVG